MSRGRRFTDTLRQSIMTILVGILGICVIIYVSITRRK